MQLFLCDFVKDDIYVSLTDKRVVRQCCVVLRMKQGDTIMLQKDAVRYTVEILQLSKNLLEGTILDTVVMPTEDAVKSVSLLVALPNSTKKLHLITQKLTEIGIGSLFFWRSERSQLKDISPQKIDKLKLISLEAVEQSRGWKIPSIAFVKDLEEVMDTENVVVFDMTWDVQQLGEIEWAVVWVVGPEWWLSSWDYDAIWSLWWTHHHVSLWATVLRTETAAIVAWWILQN